MEAEAMASVGGGGGGGGGGEESGIELLVCFQKVQASKECS